MKRGTDDEKIMGPMFPRLHVNDTDKGGPRAPPRNKMALYEQLTVPSQRYNIGSVTINRNNNINNNNLASTASASQGIGRERNICFPFYQRSVPPSSGVRHLETVSLTNETTSAEKRKKPSDEDDFTVPAFSQPGVSQLKTQNNKCEKHTHQSSNDPSSRRANVISRQLVVNQDARNCGVFNSSMEPSDLLKSEKDGGSLSEDTYGRGGHQGKQRLKHEGNILGAENRYGEGASDLPSKVAQKDVSSRQKDSFHVGFGDLDAHEVDEGMLRGRDDHLLERDNTNKGNDASETSMVDSVSGEDISPDDVVGVIGRKHFWKARTAIVNQQRVFAIQVFELHRLIKVQKLIAGSPQLLFEGSAFVSRTSTNDSPIKKYSSDYGVKAQAQAHTHTVKHKDNSPKPADKLEGTAENAVTKVPTPSQNAPQPTSYPSFSGPGPVPMPMPVPVPMPMPMPPDPKMNPWGFQQPAVQQWLVPVMTPSEGLVYKPYPAPGMMGPMYGCCGPPNPSPMMGSMMNMPYVLPTHYHQGMGMPPGGQFGGQGCLPTYPMPPMNTSISGSGVDQNQMNQFPGPNQYGNPINQPAAVNGNHSSQHQISCNMPIQNNGSATNGLKVFPPKEGEVLGSTASSPCERTGTGTGAGDPTTKGTDTLCLFPTGPTLEVSEEALVTDKTSRVIKVVPHNAKSTRESAARIFQSIQAERRQHESS